ncbi:LacI family DNA-binding transcriptional regulator [Paenibacillus sp. MMS20-IR301]|uniref:LacI family DNA-binding transcriptional regulator n=1 Tax=Paenibacillus sp. MMS20-IR301 TaxID=2895946 RepID=UPI0028EAF37F|nr:LacI family DNA-binding transcriptional regulator [Paenibacillus sp. MMS20-IR301]WNS43923.1 LacI family DNA-binding transcriptional regulator [Paenibacillus sp. MMS20-IR301]
MKLKEIARKANVSISTVSRIMNNQGNFSEETRRKVLEIANEHLKPGIAPPKPAGITYNIAVIVPGNSDFFDNDPSTSADLNHLKEEFEAYGHQVHIVKHGADLQSSPAYKLVGEEKMDAAVIFDPFVNEQLFEELERLNIPYLLTNGRTYKHNHNYIDYDNRKGAYEVIRYLHELGHRKIGILAGPKNHLVNLNRLDGCKDAFRDLKLPWSDARALMGAFDPAHGYEAVKQLMKEDPSITAMFTFNDIIAFGAMKGLAELNIRIPQDISLIGFDDLKLSEFMVPPLTTVRRFRYDISSIIVKVLTELIMNSNIAEVHISLKTELIERESCTGLASGRRE